MNIHQGVSVSADSNFRLNRQINPFPGLRPFTIQESHLFFGREGQIDEVLLKLYENKFVAVVGPSGSGKSSFIYCGLIPLLLGGFMPDRSSNWNIVVARPGSNPIDALADALLEVDEEYSKQDAEYKLMRKAITLTTLRSSTLGLAEIIQQSPHFGTGNTLVLIDQFEELFRFRKSDIQGDSVNESLAFVNLLTEAFNHADSSIYVALTMRSDFIGECSYFPALTEAINNSYYMIPQMTREQKRSAIEGPIAVGGATIAQRLVQLLLNDVGDNPDQLPILQHALMRTWDYWTIHSNFSEPIDIHHYNAIGRMEEALSQHANEAYDELNDRQKFICEKLFKALTESGTNTSGSVRRPSKLNYIASVTEANHSEVLYVIDKFRQAGRSLLTIDSSSIIDISHESLIRIWVRLKNWVDDEAEAVQMFLRLSEAGEAHSEGKAALWRPPDLQLALNWQQKHAPTLGWSERYRNDYERTMNFLTYSKREYDTEQLIEEQRRKRAIRRARAFALFLGTVAIGSLGVGLFALTQSIEAEKQREISEQNAQKAKKQEEKAKLSELAALESKAKADSSAKEALIQKELAQISAKEALQQKELALKNAERALEQEKIARENAEKAKEQQLLAEKSTEEAKRQSEIANANLKLAEEERGKAEAANKNAKNLRLLSIAQAMAVKSVNMTDVRTKALNAQQAYKFNSENGGMEYHPDIYNGLYYAIKQFEGPSYNKLDAHEDAVRALATSAVGGYMYSAGSDGDIFRWDIARSNPSPTEIYKGETIIKALAVNADNTVMASGGHDESVLVFKLSGSTATPKKVSGFGKEVWFLALSSDGKKLAVVNSTKTVFTYNTETEELLEIGKASSKINGLAMSPDGNTIAVTSENGELLVFNISNTNFEKTVLFKNKGVLGNSIALHGVAFSSDGSLLAFGDANGSLRILTKDSDYKQEYSEVLEGHKARINHICFRGDGKQLATGSLDKSVRLWNISTPKSLNDPPIVLEDHSDWVWSIAYSDDGTKILAGCFDNLIRVWFTNPNLMKDIICEKMKINNLENFSDREWRRYVAEDIDYEITCEGQPKKNQD